MSRRTSTVGMVVGILVTAVAMFAVVVLVQGDFGSLGEAVVVDRDRGSETAGTGSARPRPSGDPTAPADPRASDRSGAPGDPGERDDRTRPDSDSATSGEPGASSLSGRERAERVQPPPPPRGGGDDDDDDGGDDGDD